MELYLVEGEDSPRGHRTEVAEVGRALDQVHLDPRLAAAADVPADAVRLVWADELGASLAGIDEDDRARWLECTVLVNPGRERVVELLEEHGLLGAVQYRDVDEWREAAGPPCLFVRRNVVRHRGEWVDGPARDSDAYALWTDPDADSLAALLARYLACWRESDAELVISCDESRGRKLPPVELRLKLGGTGLLRVPPVQSPAYYVVLSSAPGGGAGFFARPVPEENRDDGLEQIARRMLQNPAGPDLLAAGGVQCVRLAGKERQSVCLFSDWFDFRTAGCAVRVEHANGVLLAIFTCSIGPTPPSCEAVLADPALRRIARSLRVLDAAPGPVRAE